MEKIDKNKILSIMNFNKVDKVFVTEDEQVFLKESDSKNHCNRTVTGKREKPLKYVKVSKEQIQAGEEPVIKEEPELESEIEPETKKETSPSKKK